MQYKTIDDQNEMMISILKQNKDLMMILDFVYELKLPNFYIAAGSIFQTVWNYLDGRPLNYNIKDIDIIYYDSVDTSKESEKMYEEKLTDHFKALNLNYEFDVHNEYIWKDKDSDIIPIYKNSEDVINKWVATVHAIGITKVNGQIKIYAPFGLSDIFSKTIRPIKHAENSKEIYDKKAKSWSERFDNLTIVEW